MKSIKENSRETHFGVYFICCAIGFIPKVILILTTAYPLNNPHDELDIFSIPARLAGLDWTSCMADYRYYGYGFSIFLPHLFESISDAVVLYRTVLILVAAVQLCIPIICCYLLYSFFGMKNNAYVILISVICTYEVSVPNVYMYNEHIYIVWVWISFFILAKLWQAENNKRKIIKYSFLLGFSFLGALTVHQRAVTLFVAFLILYIFMKIILKRKICYILPVVGVYAIGNYINSKIMDYFIRLLKYGNGIADMNVSDIQNRGIKISLSWKILQDKEYIQAVIRTVVGNLNNWNICTVGIGIFSIILGVYFIGLVYQKRKLEEEQEKLLFFGVFAVVAIAITVAGLAVSGWGWGIKKAYVDKNAASVSLRGLNYLRYLLAYYPPVLSGVLAYLYNHTEIYMKLFRYTMSITGFLIVYYLADIVPLMRERENGFGALALYSPHRYSYREMIPADYLTAAIIFIIAIFLIWVFLKRKKMLAMLVMFCVLTGWNYIYASCWTVGKSEKNNYQYVDKYSEVIKELETQNIDIPVYVRKSGGIGGTGHSLLCELQFINMNHVFYSGFPEEGLEEAVYITSFPNEAKDLLENGYEYFRLDEEEHIYVKGEQVIKSIEGYMEKEGREK